MREIYSQICLFLETSPQMLQKNYVQIYGQLLLMTDSKKWRKSQKKRRNDIAEELNGIEDRGQFNFWPWKTPSILLPRRPNFWRSKILKGENLFAFIFDLNLGSKNGEKDED